MTCAAPVLTDIDSTTKEINLNLVDNFCAYAEIQDVIDWADLEQNKDLPDDEAILRRAKIIYRLLTSAADKIDVVCNRNFYFTQYQERMFYQDTLDESLFIGDFVGDYTYRDPVFPSRTITGGTTVKEFTRDGTEIVLEKDVDWRYVEPKMRGRPYLELIRLNNFFWGSRVSVAGAWGWEGIPNTIWEASVMIVARILQRRQAQLGTFLTPQGDTVFVRKIDPDIEKDLWAYKLTFLK